MIKKLKILYLLFASILIIGCSKSVKTYSLNNSLEENFINPPDDTKPRTWMHAMSGNMSKEGLTKDLESMAEVGIGGLLLFNISQGIPNGPIIYNSPEHHEMIQHAAKESERLGLSFGVHNCDGWSSSGGPWVTPEESMKMVVWSETVVDGGNVDVTLKEPSKREGLYKDIAVLAYPALEFEIDDVRNTPQIMASSNNLDIGIITDGKVDNQSTLNMIGGDSPWITFKYQNPKTIRSVKVVFNDRHTTADLLVSDDGRNFKIAKKTLYKVRTGKGEWAINDHFEGITSKYFRLVFNQKTTIKDVVLTSNYFINNPLGRTAIARTESVNFLPIGNPEANMIINKSSIKNLTAGLNASGQLKAKLPEGKWNVLRFGYTSTSAYNRPASKEGCGLEVDKLSRKAFKSFFEGFVKKVIDSTKNVAPNALQYIEIDSYEMGGQNWTDGLDSIFNAKKGYDIINFLPLVAGRFVESPEASEAVLADYRDVITNLMTENYFAYFTELCNENGLKSYIEPYGFGPLNDLDIGGKTDIPMGEFWMNRPITQVESAVSSAHIYGKPVISAESFTSTPEINWKGNPAMAKTSGDLAWTYGINEFMFHRFAHQANTNVEPGMTMNRWGFHFDRTQTWWENAGADWFKYIARGSYMLRQGNPVSDLLVYIGEETPVGSYHRRELGFDLPKYINFDNVNTDVLVNRIEIQENQLVLPEGTSYKMLLLKNSETLSLPTLKSILKIAKAGVPVMGDVPKNLAGYNKSDADKVEFSKLQSQLASIMYKDISNLQKLLSNHNIKPDLTVNNGEPVDFAHRKTKNEDIYFFFNPDTIATKTFDISFRVANKIPELWNPMTGKIEKNAVFANLDNITTTSIRLNAGESTFVVFRESSKTIQTVEQPDENINFSLSKDNQITAVISKNGEYEIPISSGDFWKTTISDIPKPLEISGPWEVTFNKDNGYGGTKRFDNLIDWKDHSNDSIKYYSGTAVYLKKINIPTELGLNNNTVATLNLGKVSIIADVTVNGKHVAVSWMSPFKVDISDYLITGENTIEIALTNQWSNRLIGDERYPANDDGYKLGGYGPGGIMPQWYINNEPRPKGKRTTFTTAPFYKKDSPLVSSGLIGPVQIEFSKKVVYNNN